MSHGPENPTLHPGSFFFLTSNLGVAKAGKQWGKDLFIFLEGNPISFPETNIAPENRPFDPIGKACIPTHPLFRGDVMLVSGMVAFIH